MKGLFFSLILVNTIYNIFQISWRHCSGKKGYFSNSESLFSAIKHREMSINTGSSALVTDVILTVYVGVVLGEELLKC